MYHNKLTEGSLVALLALEEVLGWSYGAELWGLSLKRKEDGWQLVVKVKIDTRAMVAFVHTARVREAIEILLEQADKGNVKWYVDKFP